jgi:hypothetical protein
VQRSGRRWNTGLSLRWPSPAAAPSRRNGTWSAFMQTSLCAAGNSICRRSRCPPTRGHRVGQAVLPHLRRIVPARGSLRGVARPSLAYCCVALFATRGAVVVPLRCARPVLVLMFTARADVRTMDAALGDAAAPTDNPSSGPASRGSQMAHVACGPQSWIPWVVGARRLTGDSRVLRRGSVCGWRGQRALLWSDNLGAAFRARALKSWRTMSRSAASVRAKLNQLIGMSKG